MTTRPRVALALLALAPAAANAGVSEEGVLDLPSLVSNATGALQLVAFVLWLQITHRRLDDILNCCGYALEKAEELLGGANDDGNVNGSVKGGLSRLLLTASGGLA